MKESVKKIIDNSKKYVATNILFMTFIITSVINGLIIRNFTIKNIFAVKPFLADLVVVLLIASFAYFIKPKHRFKYFFVWSIILTGICLINGIYYKNYLSFASLSLLTTLTQLGGYTDAVVENILELSDFIYLWQIFALIFVHLQLKKRKTYYEEVEKVETPKLRFLNTFVVTLVLLGLFISTLTGVDLSRLNKQWNREYVVKEFGIYAYQFNDGFVYLRTKFNSMFGYDEAAKHFREFFANVPDAPLETNMYTDIFKGKNVIIIHAESIQNFLISDPNFGGEPASFNGIDVTPNLNKLASEGIYFSNFYAQEGAGTSSDTEFTLNASLLPSSSGTVFMNYFNREYVTIPKMLRDMGYHTFSMHGNKGSAWNRSVVHPKLGYNHFYHYTNAYELDEIIGLGLSDKSFFRQSVDIISKIDEQNTNWYGLLIMLTNHTPFSGINDYSEKTGWTYEVNYKYESYNEFTEKTEEYVDEYMEGTRLGNYFISSRYADEAIGEFIEALDEAGLLENTVVIIYGDHDNKLRRSEYNRYYNYDPYKGTIRNKDDEGYILVDDYTYELNRSVPLIIWTKDLAGTKYNQRVTTVMGMVDVQPTLGNMMGFYNKFALGNDIFSIEENIVVFPSGNWLTNKVYYHSAKNAYRQIDLETEITKDYLDYWSDYADELNTISNAIIVHDLIKKVGFNLENELIDETGGGEE